MPPSEIDWESVLHRRFPLFRPCPLLKASLAAIFVLLLHPASVLGKPPPEGDCPSLTATPSQMKESIDAAPITLREGMELGTEDMLLIRQLVPAELWRYREVFFFEGMSMEIGPCHRRYAIPGFYEEATEKFKGDPYLDDDNDLKAYTAGVPFPPESIDPKSDDAAQRWAWNLAKRYRGAGFAGKFRITDYPTSIGKVQVYEGDQFFLQASGRTDLPEDDYKIPNGKNRLFAAGGEFTKPFNARFLAWRQFRPKKSEQSHTEPDNIFVYVPTMRKVRRAASTWVDGLFFPSYAYSGDSGGGGMTFGDPTGGGSAGINPTSGQSSAATTHVKRGQAGLAIRPNAYVWRYLGEKDVLAPLNVKQEGYPKNPARNYGVSGLSLASDTWDVRRAVVIEGALKERNESTRTVTIYIDYQTHQPLYWITRTDRRRIQEVGILAHRFTGDVFDYPDWPGGKQTTVFEPVAGTFYNALAGRGGWRREAYDLTSVPFSRNKRQRMMSADALMRSH